MGDRGCLAVAADAGQASFYASGIFPGFASDQLALVLSTLSSSIRTVRAFEVALNDHYPVASLMMDGMGFGRPLDFEPLIARPGAIQ
jgi:2,4-diaminopentanoate dehydrogenase